MTKLLKYSLFIIGALFVIGFFINRNENYSSAPSVFQNKANIIKINGQNYELTFQNKMMAKNIIKEDFKIYAEGGDTITTDELQRDYEKNEVAADEKYKDHYFFVSGRIQDIKRSIGKNYYLELNGGSNMFMHPSAHMEEQEKNYLATLNKGEKVHLFCRGEGMIIGSAHLGHCISASTFAERESNKYIDTIKQKIEAGDKTALSLLLYASAVAETQPAESVCFSQEEKAFKECTKLLDKLPEEKKEEIKKNAEKLVDKYGINVKDIANAT